MAAPVLPAHAGWSGSKRAGRLLHSFCPRANGPSSSGADLALVVFTAHAVMVPAQLRSPGPHAGFPACATAGPAEALRVESQWADAATPTFVSQADAIIKLYSADKLLPRRFARRALGYSDTDIRDMEAEAYSRVIGSD